jgi:uncharacterized membrane protein
MNFCIQSGHVLERWKTVVNTMIPKDVGNAVIHIYEADLNLLLAVKWRDLLRSNDANSWIITISLAPGLDARHCHSHSTKNFDMILLSPPGKLWHQWITMRTAAMIV